MSETALQLKNLSKHLFWDVSVIKLDSQKNKKQIIKRVLDYGLFRDWQIISNYYGINEIAKVALTIRDLDNKSISFISLLSKIPKEKFLCYTTKQLIPKHWNF